MKIVHSTARHALADGQVHLLGAVSCVTGAMTRVETGGACLLVDGGITQGNEARSWVFPEAARDVDAVLLTHGHNDHVGSLPQFIDGGFDKPILRTTATLDVTELVLRDELSLNGASAGEIAQFQRVFR